MPEPAPILQVRGIAKRFPGVIALSDVDLDIRAGEVHALAGQNGAGKSTLIKILSGDLAPDAGQLILNGQPVRLAGPIDAIARGIATISQEMSLVPTLSVAENILIGRLPLRRGRRIDWRAVRRRADTILQGLGFALDPDMPVHRLTVAQQQAVEIAKALSRDARVVIMDEPTSALAAREVDLLLDTVIRLRAAGTAIIYVSHRFEEVFRIADRISVFREGRCLGTLDAAATSHDAVVRLMIGRDMAAPKGRGEAPAGDRPVVLAVAGLTRAGAFADISFELRAGEVLGISGLVGSGRSEIVRAIFGVDPFDAGTVTLHGRPIAHPRPDRMIARGMGLAPEDRKRHGLVLGMSVGDNLSLAALAQRAGPRAIGRERARAREQVRALNIRTPSLATPVVNLSGGNQQKVVIGKWLEAAPGILILDEPTRGIDIAAKAEIMATIRDLAAGGMAVIVISSEQSEILTVSDRILVIHQGRIAAELDPESASPETLTQAAFGRAVPAAPAAAAG